MNSSPENRNCNNRFKKINQGKQLNTVSLKEQELKGGNA
jgi:hypothetical protein